MRAVLMLHSIDESGSVLSMTAAQLRSLVSAISSSGHRILPLAELLSGPVHEDAVALTFDDGMQTLATTAAPVLAETNTPATLFLTTGFVGKDNGWPSQPADSPRLPLMGWAEITTLKKQGWDIQAHSISHPDLRTLSDTQLDAELCEPVATIRQRLGHTPTLFAYPYGYVDQRVRDHAARHFQRSVSTRMAVLSAENLTDLHRIPRLDTYYFRDERVHRHFGHKRFRAYVEARALLRRARKHPGECR
jgi:peptidoglycan/xylan/chitin deacetylase (PgdA/CDA1 family)